MNNDKDFNLNTEDKILLFCARNRSDPENKLELEAMIHEDLNWQYLFEIATIHKLKPLLYYNLNTIVPNRTSKNFLDDLKIYYKKNARKNLLLTGELIRVTNSLNSQNINSFTYKGPTLATLAYKNIALRDFSDIDLVVSLKNVKKSIIVLKNMGYTSTFPSMLEKGNICLKYHRAHVLSKGNVNIDLQWGLSFIKHENLNNFETKDLIKININKIELLTPNVENQIIILVMHNASHMWHSLSLLCDLDGLISMNKVNWNEVKSLATKIGINRILLINLLLLKNVMGNPVLTEYWGDTLDIKAEKLASKIEKNFFSPEKFADSFFKRALLQFQIRENKIDGLSDLFYLVFNPTAEDYQRIYIPNSIFKLYYLIRLFNLIKKYLK
ncbi:hypothetical protein Metbo_0853 [Methanobacterium lacus]|uniref:Nucleotidyltransferase family protein n=1 Tax=Methanobacterium lacus (strain AL-21) TaxID=877455 RepID=F0TBM6_METLA|nr:nucleotidyltransferase family protein [Methanobacterium lacus]ADZ09103.1 hypothetical protein Metbo_0853 [Methanobacterium lacus]